MIKYSHSLLTIIALLVVNTMYRYYALVVSETDKSSILATECDDYFVAAQLAADAFVRASNYINPREGSEYGAPLDVLTTGSILVSNKNDYYAMITPFSNKDYIPLLNAIEEYNKEATAVVASIVSDFLVTQNGIPLNENIVDSICDMALYTTRLAITDDGQLLNIICYDWRFKRYRPFLHDQYKKRINRTK